MRLYYAPDTCSLSPHIMSRELNLGFELMRVNNRSKATADGRDFFITNPKEYVVAFGLDDGQILTEGPATMQYLADRKPEYGLAPCVGSWEKVRLQEWLNFTTSEIHTGSTSLFNSALAEDVKTIFRNKLFRRFDFPQTTLSEKTYLTDPSSSVVGAYPFMVLGWYKFFVTPLSR